MAWPIRAALLANSDWFTLFAEALGRGGKGPEAKPPFVDVAPPLGKDQRRRRERGGRESREFWSREAKEGRVRPTGRSREDEEERGEAHSPHCPASPRAQEGRSFDLSPSLATSQSLRVSDLPLLLCPPICTHSDRISGREDLASTSVLGHKQNSAPGRRRLHPKRASEGCDGRRDSEVDLEEGQALPWNERSRGAERNREGSERHGVAEDEAQRFEDGGGEERDATRGRLVLEGHAGRIPGSPTRLPLLREGLQADHTLRRRVQHGEFFSFPSRSLSSSQTRLTPSLSLALTSSAMAA